MSEHGEEQEPRRYAKVAEGCRTTEAGESFRVVCTFPAEMHAEIKQRARSAGTSYAEQVRVLVTWGLEA